MHRFSPICTLQHSDDLFYQIDRNREINQLTNWIFRNKLLWHTSVISSNPTRSSCRPRISHSVHWIWFWVPFLCDMGLWIKFLTMIYARIALKFPWFFKLRHLTFPPTLKSTTEKNLLASLVNEANKAQTGILIAESYIMDSILQTGISISLSLLMWWAWGRLWMASLTLYVYLSNAVLDQ